MKNKKVVVGMSGGVDSSMAALLLKKQGYSPIGVSLRYCIWEQFIRGWRESLCCSNESFRQAKKVCLKIGVPHEVIDVSGPFRKIVFDYFLKSLRRGETPNPCVVCNRYLKFPALMEVAKKNGVKWVATGHYVKKRKTKNEKRKIEYSLLRGKDRKKDQSYFLCLLNQKMLSRVIFPLGEKTKAEVYQLAEKEGFKEFKKNKQSQDICFVTEKDLQSFLRYFIGEKPGKIVDEKGNILGKHQGVFQFTIGQRKGLRLSGGPWYVVGFKGDKVVVTRNSHSSLLRKKEVELANFNFIARSKEKNLEGKARLRSTQPLKKAKLVIDGKKAKLVFAEPVWAVTPGQFGVFYKGEACVGGGQII